MAPSGQEESDEQTRLLYATHKLPIERIQHDEASSVAASHITQDEKALSDSAVGERLPYNDYTVGMTFAYSDAVIDLSPELTSHTRR